MADKTWKKFERRVAKFFGVKRNPLSGFGSGFTAADIRHDKLFVECKLRKTSAVHNLFDKTEGLAAIEHKIPVLALQKKYDKGWLLVCRPEDLYEINRRQIERKLND